MHSCKHMHMCASFLSLLVPLEGIVHLLQNCTSAKYATQWTNTFSFWRNDEYPGACRWKKVHARKSLALPGMVQSQEREQPYFNTNSGLLVSTQSSLKPSYSVTMYTGEREKGDANAHVSSILLYLIGHLPTTMTAGRMQPVLTLCIQISIARCTRWQ